ncbi:hypothetical protein [Yinghuangia soli]|uniref:J domain-containing protein n=1 Tax=Yinghuangia soli TaxID=2908204 RepID=A0AA41U0H6_9ACTN|nr:hypothetical protein [Yinghuangia soli]MCF2526427.1 hypothetical protein [Yinghuangia soli]
MNDGMAPAMWTDPQVSALETQVAAVEAALLDAEVDVTTLRVELDNLAIVHHRRLGPLYERLDELDALVAEAVAARSGDADDIRRALEARAIVDPMPDIDDLLDAFGGAEAGAAPEAEVRRVKPSDEARRLYRELARRAHPDLAQDPAEKDRRSGFIVRVNAAYAAGDVATLMALDEEWAAGPGTAPAAAVPDRLEWLRTRLALLDARRTQLAAEREALLDSPMGQLLALAPDDPDGLLEHLAEQLLSRIDDREKELAGLLG